MERLIPKYIAVFEGPVEQWTIKFLRKNQWKVSSRYEFEDLKQESYIKFLICYDRYASVNNLSHFISLYQSCVRNMMNDMSLSIYKEREHLYEPAFDEDPDDIFRLIMNYDHAGDLLIEFNRASPELKLFLQALCGDKGSCFGDRFHGGYKKTRKGNKIAIRETSNEHYCRLMGFDPERVNIIYELKAILL